MRNILAIARKELSVYFTTPWAWIVFTAMAAITGFFFLGALSQFRQVHELAKSYSWDRLPPDYAVFRNLTEGVVVQLFSVVLVVTLFVAPFLSMRLFAEERQQKTFELLMTTPINSLEVVLGKYLGGLGIISATLGITLIYPLILSAFGASESGHTLEWSTICLGYGGLLLWGATCMAIGMCVSAFTSSQMVAAFITFALLLPWMLIRGLTQRIEEPIKSIVNYLSFEFQLQNLMKGVFDPKAIIFFLSIVVLSIVVTHRAVEAQRWT